MPETTAVSGILQVRLNTRELYRRGKESIERVFADTKEKHAMRYTQYRGLAQITNWVKLKLAAFAHRCVGGVFSRGVLAAPLRSLPGLAPRVQVSGRLLSVRHNRLGRFQ